MRILSCFVVEPDKPGTRGEILSILLHSLGGMDQKLLIILNKADQFKKVCIVCVLYLVGTRFIHSFTMLPASMDHHVGIFSK